MCGRFVIASSPEALRLFFGYKAQPNFPARYNVAPTQPVPVITMENGARHFRLMRWGLLPSWVKDLQKFTLLINARSETVLEKPAFRNAMRRRRCLLPVDGYYEWQQMPGYRQPFFIHPRDGQPIGFAGLAETWIGPNGEELDTVAIVTAAAGPDLAPLHYRVPVTIAPRDFDRWLDTTVDAEAAKTLLIAPPEGSFAFHAVSMAVNRTANDEPQLILPVTAEDAAVLLPAKTGKSKAANKSAQREIASAMEDDNGQGSLF